MIRLIRGRLKKCSFFLLLFRCVSVSFNLTHLTFCFVFTYLKQICIHSFIHEEVQIFVNISKYGWSFWLTAFEMLTFSLRSLSGDECGGSHESWNMQKNKQIIERGAAREQQSICTRVIEKTEWWHSHRPPALFTAYFRVMELRLVPNTVIWALDLIHLHCCASHSSRGKLLKYWLLLSCQLSILYQRPFVMLTVGQISI